MTFGIPFLIGFVIATTSYAVDVIYLIAMGATILLFLIFNVIRVCSKLKICTLLFMIPALASFIPILMNDNLTIFEVN